MNEHYAEYLTYTCVTVLCRANLSDSILCYIRVAQGPGEWLIARKHDLNLDCPCKVVTFGPRQKRLLLR